MQYPQALTPTDEEPFALPNGETVFIPKATPAFARWDGPRPSGFYGRKPCIDFHGELVYAELAILRVLQEAGWDGVWVDTFRSRYLIDLETQVALAPERAEILQSIYRESGDRNGCFDVFAWAGSSILFAEAKHSQKDRIRDTQVRWLNAALRCAIPIESLLVVEWSLEGDSGAL